jgi:hypothetical protein
MIRLLFIGNSHLAALKSAWDAAPPPGIAAEFFGAPQRAWQRMALLPDNDFGLAPGGDFGRQRKITEQANGKSTVSLADQDAIVIVGGFSAAEAVAALLATCDVVPLRETGAPSLLSDVLFAKACTALAADALPEPGWRNRADAKIAVLPRPATNESCLGSTNDGFQSWHRLATNPNGAAAGFAAFDAALTTALATQGITYLPQPPETRTSFGATARGFLAEGGGVVAGEENRRGDHAHMNTAYGAACIGPLLIWLNSQTPT